MEKIGLQEKVKMSVEERNALLTSLPKSEARVMLAQDMIEAIEQRRFLPKRGRYLSLGENFDLLDDFGFDFGFDAIFEGNASVGCKACIIGGMALSVIFHQDNFRLRDFSRNGGNHVSSVHYLKIVSEYFTPAQMRLMEVAFEGDTESLEDCEDLARELGGEYDEEDLVWTFPEGGVVDRALNLGIMWRPLSDSAAMVALLENVIAHGGEFVP